LRLAASMRIHSSVASSTVMVTFFILGLVYTKFVLHEFRVNYCATAVTVTETHRYSPSTCVSVLLGNAIIVLANCFGGRMPPASQTESIRTKEGLGLSINCCLYCHPIGSRQRCLVLYFVLAFEIYFSVLVGVRNSQ
jgi:hypothetical protein